jgi:hypothetical protein
LLIEQVIKGALTNAGNGRYLYVFLELTSALKDNNSCKTSTRLSGDGQCSNKECRGVRLIKREIRSAKMGMRVGAECVRSYFQQSGRFTQLASAIK